jgi:hypothetical protein
MQEYAVASVDAAFVRSREQFEVLVAGLGSPQTNVVTHAELEERIGCQGRELLRCLLQDHLDLRTAQEVRHAAVTGADAVVRRTVERDHDRALSSVFGEVRVTRMAYRVRGSVNVYPTDAVLNLPIEKHSHGLRRLAAVESVRGSFEAAGAAIGRVTGHELGKRQVETLAQRAAVDIDAFYAARLPGCCPDGDVLVLSADGKGIVMRPDALREATSRAAAASGRKLATRLSKGEKRNRKRMAEVGAVYDVTPAVRAPEDIITPAGGDQPARPVKGPVARDKWLTASVEHDTTTVIDVVFDEAQRRDPEHRRPWVALVDGNAHQIEVIRAQATRRGVAVAIVLDFVHVLEYLWKAAWCFYREGDQTAETWVAEHARRVLEGRSSVVAAAIRRKATCRGLTTAQRTRADTAANYLIRNRPYLDYVHALKQGWPIATGVIEGACRHLVKDRMDLTGARWGLAGAEAVLTLRALSSNGDFDRYWDFHLQQEHRRIHQTARRPHRDQLQLTA